MQKDFLLQRAFDFTFQTEPKVKGLDSIFSAGASYWPIKSIRQETIARFPRHSRLSQQIILKNANAAFARLQDFSTDEWFALLRQAGLFLKADFSPGSPQKSEIKNYLKITSLSTGLPEIRIKKALVRLAEELINMRDILSEQVESGDLDVLSNGGGLRWNWTPAGRNVFVRVPGNFPTINTMWLMALALRRPVLLCPTLTDPFTCLWLSESLHKAGLPEGSISICFNSAPVWFDLADQILWSGKLTSFSSEILGKLHLYHHGRSKAIILDIPASDNSLWERLAAMALRGCGRLCTNLSAILVEEKPEYTAFKLAEKLADHKILPLDHPKAILPAFNSPSDVKNIIQQIEEAKERGAIDISEKITGLSLLQKRNGITFLRPTVLQVCADDKIFGTELPFPFVTVAAEKKENFVTLCRNSLIVSVIGKDDSLIKQLSCEPKIDKLFHGDQFDRDYTPSEPHEGYLVDFLFRKKIICPKIN